MVNIKRYLKYLKHLHEDSLSRDLEKNTLKSYQQSFEYLEWINSDLVRIAEEFVIKQKILTSYFIRIVQRTFSTNRFEFLVKRWVVHYYLNLFQLIDSYALDKDRKDSIILEKSPLNEYAVEQYYLRFKNLPPILWKNKQNTLSRFIKIVLNIALVLYKTLKNGLKFKKKIISYTVMRESLYGLYDVGGYYFHDDFFVDGEKIKKEDLLLFSRGIPVEEGRLKAYHQAKNSEYAHFVLGSLSIGLKQLFFRIIPKYIFSASYALIKELKSESFSLFNSIFQQFYNFALPYEQVFSHYRVISELGHNYFSSDHIVESIICQNYKTKYYLMHWSDNSIGIDKHLLSFLSCDKFLLWGKAHTQSVEGNSDIFLPIGYVFKRFINNIKTDKQKILRQMHIKPQGKIISFFDESFGGEIKMTQEHFVTFWETAAKLASERKEDTILIKPKVLMYYKKLSDTFKKRFTDTLAFLKSAGNAYIIDEEKWSFIEVIGVSDVVITQGMTSSATIAIICGIEGLYLDQAHYAHPFSSDTFRGKIVFDDPNKLLNMIYKILDNNEKPSKIMPEELLREFDTYPDDQAIDILRDILTDKNSQYLPKRGIGIIVQARMGSSRLPGKVMMDILGKPMLKHIIERLKRIEIPNTIIIATTLNKNDDIIAELALREKVSCFRGDEEDVLSRYYQTAKKYKIDTIVRITADCPLVDPALINELIDFYFRNQPLGYASNTIERTYPQGFDVEVFSFLALEKAFKNANKPYQHEHVTPFIYENERCFNYKSDKDYSKYRLTVDTTEDFKLISRIFNFFGNNEFNYQEVVDLLNKNRELAEINRNIKQKIFTK